MERENRAEVGVKVREKLERETKVRKGEKMKRESGKRKK